MISSVVQSLRVSWLRRRLEHRGVDPSASVIICSEPRSGSTWLLELFGQLPGAVCSWEPLHPTRGTLPPSWEMGWRPHVPEDEPHPQLEAWFDDLLRFRIGNRWTFSHVTAEAARNAEIGVHKFVRANLLLPWMVRHLHLQRRPIVLVRHPLATVGSQGTNFEGARAAPVAVPHTAEDEYAAIVHEQRHPVLALVAAWSHRNRRVLNDHALRERLIVVHYEDLATDPVSTMTRLLEEVSWPLPFDVDALHVARASRSDFDNQLVTDPHAQISKWVDRIDPDLLAPAQAVLDRFGITCYRADQARPIAGPPT